MGIEAHFVTEGIKSIGATLGFDRVGVAPPDLSIWGERYGDWIEQGYEGEMRYMSRDVDRRTDPRCLFPEVKSLVVVSMNYFPGDEHRRYLDNLVVGYIANYALNEDYHEVIRSRLEELFRHISKMTDGKAGGKIYVDTGPILEKPLAVSGGLGWMGKHSILIGPEAGSWLSLGVLLLDIDLDFDAPVPDRCGECTKCMDACPTKAIVAPYVVDARRCISYLLGELKGPIPVKMRPLIGNRIFGCDDCQWVCPWNNTARIAGEEAFRPREELRSPLLSDLMEIDEEDFGRIFKTSPIKRVKRSRFLRNVAVALGNSRDRKAIPVLEKRLKDADPMVKEHVEWALERIG